MGVNSQLELIVNGVISKGGLRGGGGGGGGRKKRPGRACQHCDFDAQNLSYQRIYTYFVIFNQGQSLQSKLGSVV